MLMAAGLGTRLRPFTEREPKAFLPLMGVPMAQFTVDALIAAGVDRIVINVHHHAEMSRARIGALERAGSEILVSDERPLILGSAGGIRKALPWFRGEPFFLVNADVLSGIDLSALASHHLKMRKQYGALITLAVLPGVETAAYREIGYDPGTLMVHRLGEVVTGKPYFASAAVIEPEALQHLEEGPSEFVPAILAPAVAAGRACVLPVQALWKDVGSPGLWLDAHVSLIRGLETGALPRGIRRRIEGVSRRVAEGIWIEKGRRMPAGSQWAGPCFWGGGADSRARPPKELGPRAVLYGKPLNAPLENGIGLGEAWTCD